MFCAGCTSGRISERNPRLSQGIEIHSFKDEFRYFMKTSQNTDANTVWKNWQDQVESKDPLFFQEVVADSLDTQDWQEKYRTSMKNAWPYFVKYADEINAEFDKFASLLEENLMVFQKIFPDFDISKVPIYAAPSLLRFNGQGSEASGRRLLAFGIDMIVVMREEPKLIPRMVATSNPKVLYAHEIFHIYHGLKQGVNRQVILAKGTLANGVWNEGLATYISGQINPQASDGDLLMDSELARQCQLYGERLLRRFKSVAHDRLQTPVGKAEYRDWFLLSSKDNSLPIRAGYCVGLVLARKIAAAHIDIREMVSWNFEDIPTHLDNFMN